jgi:hypothetical protein
MNPIEIEPELDEDEAIDQLNEIYGEVDVCGIKYDAGYLLKEVDPIAFEQARGDLEDSMEHKWECGNCGEQYDSEDEAGDCCQDACANCGVMYPLTELKDGLCEGCLKAKESDYADS